MLGDCHQRQCQQLPCQSQLQGRSQGREFDLIYASRDGGGDTEGEGCSYSLLLGCCWSSNRLYIFQHLEESCAWWFRTDTWLQNLFLHQLQIMPVLRRRSESYDTCHLLNLKHLWKTSNNRMVLYFLVLQFSATIQLQIHVRIATNSAEHVKITLSSISVLSTRLGNMISMKHQRSPSASIMENEVTYLC